ncbi:MAG: hypothetical protein ACRD10_12220, partial [Terriglobia bacterium]
MLFEDEREPDEEFEDFTHELSSDYREEDEEDDEEGSNDEEKIEEGSLDSTAGEGGGTADVDSVRAPDETSTRMKAPRKARGKSKPKAKTQKPKKSSMRAAGSARKAVSRSTKPKTAARA